MLYEGHDGNIVGQCPYRYEDYGCMFVGRSLHFYGLHFFAVPVVACYCAQFNFMQAVFFLWPCGGLFCLLHVRTRTRIRVLYSSSYFYSLHFFRTRILVLYSSSHIVQTRGNNSTRDMRALRVYHTVVPINRYDICTIVHIVRSRTMREYRYVCIASIPYSRTY